MPSSIRFGIFEADLEAGDLRRSGVRIKLQNQPLRVLSALIERPGELVTRDELRRRIWANDTQVDFERGLNKAINRLRIALSDSAESPKFIETLPRRGYRFICAIERESGSIAVLPILNLSGSSEQDHLSDGLTDELIGVIANIRSLRVIARTSTMRFKASDRPLAEIARQLDVNTVVQGSLQLANDKVRIRVAVIDPRNDRHLWAKAFEGDLADIMNLGMQVAEEVARQLRPQPGNGQDELSRHRSKTIEREAYEACLKGRYFWNKRTEPDIDKAIELFKRAIGLNASYAEAYAGLAEAFVAQALFGLRSPREVYPKAQAAAAKALELNDMLAEAHNCIADIHKGYTWNWQLAEKEYQRALQLNSNNSLAHQWYGGLLLVLGRREEAIEECYKARTLDPLSLPINAFLGYVHMKTGQYAEARERCTAAIELDPTNPFGHWIMSRVLDAQHDLLNALEESEIATRCSGSRMPYVAQLAYASARIGEPDRARAILGQLNNLSKSQYVSAYPIAAIHCALGNTNAAFGWLQRSYEERSPRLIELPDPAFAGLESDARFAEFLERIRRP